MANVRILGNMVAEILSARFGAVAKSKFLSFGPWQCCMIRVVLKGHNGLLAITDDQLCSLDDLVRRHPGTARLALVGEVERMSVFALLAASRDNELVMWTGNACFFH